MIGATELSMGAAAGGYAAGLIAEQIAIRRASRDTAPVAGIYEEVMAMDQPEQETVQRATVGQRVGRIAAKQLLPVSMALAAGLNTYAWADTPNEAVKPTLEVVVDHSGATAFADGSDKPAVQAIDAAVAEFAKSKDFKAQAIVASSGKETITSLKQALGSEDLEPFGPAEMRAATELALNATREVQSKKLDVTGKPTAAVLVLTNGNVIGDVSSVVSKASQQIGGARVSTPVYVLNTNPEAPAAKDLKQIAKQSHAQYWDATVDPKTLPDYIADRLSDGISAEEDGKQPKLPLKILGGMSLLLAGGVAVTRRQRIFGRGLNG